MIRFTLHAADKLHICIYIYLTGDIFSSEATLLLHLSVCNALYNKVYWWNILMSIQFLNNCCQSNTYLYCSSLKGHWISIEEIIIEFFIFKITLGKDQIFFVYKIYFSSAVTYEHRYSWMLSFLFFSWLKAWYINDQHPATKILNMVSYGFVFSSHLKSIIYWGYSYRAN